jgi:hypothetical protein
MARPLPKMKAPAWAKKRRIVASSSGVAATAKQAGAERLSHAGGAWATIVTTPESRNSQAISDSVQAVTTAITAKITHCSLSLAIVSFASLYAASTMMPITAAPTP